MMDLKTNKSLHIIDNPVETGLEDLERDKVTEQVNKDLIAFLTSQGFRKNREGLYEKKVGKVSLYLNPKRKTLIGLNGLTPINTKDLEELCSPFLRDVKYTMIRNKKLPKILITSASFNGNNAVEAHNPKEIEKKVTREEVNIPKRFFTYIKGKRYIKKEGLIWALQRLFGFNYTIKTQILQYPTKGNEMHCIVKASIQVANQTVENIGEASPEDTHSKNSIVRLATTRAITRAINLIVNGGFVYIEEGSHED